MNRITNLYKNKGLSLFSALLIGFIALTGIQGCSSSSSSTPSAAPLPDQDASGLFKSGTAELNSGATMLNDLRAFVYQSRIMMFSVNGHILYDGQITSITSDDYTATVDVYELGVKTQSGVIITGKVTSQAQITGTVAGTASYSGTFTLTYDDVYETVVPIPTVTKIWKGELMTKFSLLGDLVADDVGVLDDGTVKLIFGNIFDTGKNEACDFKNLVSEVDNINMYTFIMTFASSQKCMQLPSDSDFTGLASVLSETGTDKEFLIAFTDGNFSAFGLLVFQ